jgi:antitoxin component YwqK of YwqJK toxin-antitoxin module
VAVVVGLGALNKWIAQKSPQSLSSPQIFPAASPVVKPKAKKKSAIKITEKLTLDPNRAFYLARFFAEGKEILECNVTDQKVYDCTAEIPDGKVEFVNETDNTYGEEYYRNGVRDGDRREYYGNEQLKKESSYLLGTLRTHKEYFMDGTLRMEQDFRDSLWLENNTETGIGKVYYRSGTLMYEWHLTNKGQGGYTKSYNQSGQVVTVKYFDAKGNLVSTEKF